MFRVLLGATLQTDQGGRYYLPIIFDREVSMPSSISNLTYTYVELNPLTVESPRISIIIVDYYGERYLERLFSSLSSQTFQEFEVIVVDNGNNLQLPETTLRTRILRPHEEKNIGFAAGCNIGAKSSNCDWLVFLNNDTVLDKSWLINLFRRLESDPLLGAAVSKIKFCPSYTKLSINSPVFRPMDLGIGNDKRSLGVRVRFERSWRESTGILCQQGFHGVETVGEEDWCWCEQDANLWIPLQKENMADFVLTIDTPIELVGQRVWIQLGGQKREVFIDGTQHRLSFQLMPSDIFDVINSAGSELNDFGVCLETGIYEIDKGQFDIPREVTAFSGCSVMIRKQVFQLLGGFDPKFFAYYEDTDLSWRMRKAGWKIMYEPRSVLRHHRSGTSGEQSPFFCYHIYRNMRWSVAKNARIGIAVSLLARELFSWIPRHVNRNSEFSACRLKRETILGMVRYLMKRVF